MARSTIESKELVQKLLPKMMAAEQIVSSTLQTMIEQAENESISQLINNQKIEFELEISMIRMNLNHLVARYSSELEAAMTKGFYQPFELEEHEAFAIKSAYTLYKCIKECQRA